MKTNPIAPLIFFAIVLVGGSCAYAVATTSEVAGIVVGILTFLVATIAASSVKVANQDRKSVV